jgi:hypothetical protein
VGGSGPLGRARLCVAGPSGQEIIGDAINNNQQQVEVGEHRGSFWESAVTERTADFDLPRYVSFSATIPPQAVALLI